jgi:hypothetical protein
MKNRPYFSLLETIFPRDAQRDFIAVQLERETGEVPKECVSLEWKWFVNLFPDKEDTKSV